MRFFPPLRHLGLVAAALAAVLGLWAAALQPAWLVLALVGIFLCGVGIHDLLQTRRAVLRNYPVIGHFRYLLEGIRAEIRQYFIESDSDELPFSRHQRLQHFRNEFWSSVRQCYPRAQCGCPAGCFLPRHR